MYNHRDVLGIVFNVIIILLLLAFIVVGLNFIGVYDLPDNVEKVLGTYKEAETENASKKDEVVDTIVYENGEDIFVTASDITFENAHLLLKNISPSNNYSHEIVVEYFTGSNASYSEKITVNRKKSLYSATLFDANSNVIKTIKENENGHYVVSGKTPDQQAEYPVGAFDISDECGFILTAENFLTGNFALDEASFLLGNGAYGGEITIIFNTVVDEYVQKEKYVISLDFGVVISAECYENDILVYKMKTKSIEIA